MTSVEGLSKRTIPTSRTSRTYRKFQTKTINDINPSLYEGSIEDSLRSLTEDDTEQKKTRLDENYENAPSFLNNYNHLKLMPTRELLYDVEDSKTPFIIKEIRPRQLIGGAKFFYENTKEMNDIIDVTINREPMTAIIMLDPAVDTAVGKGTLMFMNNDFKLNYDYIYPVFFPESTIIDNKKTLDNRISLVNIRYTIPEPYIADFDDYVIIGRGNDIILNDLNYIQIENEDNFILISEIKMSDNDDTACKKYSHHWDSIINGMLLDPNYFTTNSTYLIKNSSKYGVGDIVNIQKVAETYDFQLKSIYNKKYTMSAEQLTVYRGMSRPYEFGESRSYVHPNYLSTSKLKNVAMSFAVGNPPAEMGFLYILHIDPYIPFIEMVGARTEYPAEGELLFPPNLILTPIEPFMQYTKDLITGTKVTLYNVRVSRPQEMTEALLAASEQIIKERKFFGRKVIKTINGGHIKYNNRKKRISKRRISKRRISKRRISKRRISKRRNKSRKR